MPQRGGAKPKKMASAVRSVSVNNRSPMRSPPAPVAGSPRSPGYPVSISSANGPQGWSAGELMALPAAIAADAFLRGQSPSERKDWPAILALFNDIRAFVEPSVAGTPRIADHLRCQWRNVGRNGKFAERERTIGAFTEKFARVGSSSSQEPSRAAVIDLAKSLAKEKAEAALRDAAAVAKQKAEARREQHKLHVQRLRAARAARTGAPLSAPAIAPRPSSGNSTMVPPPPPPRAPARIAATIVPPPTPAVPAQFWPEQLPPVEEVSFRPVAFRREREPSLDFFFLPLTGGA